MKNVVCQIIKVSHFICCSRQIQRLRDFKGAECEKHNYHSPRGPAMLGTRLHVVSTSNPVSALLHISLLSVKFLCFITFIC